MSSVPSHSWLSHIFGHPHIRLVIIHNNQSSHRPSPVHRSIGPPVYTSFSRTADYQSSLSQPPNYQSLSLSLPILRGSGHVSRHASPSSKDPVDPPASPFSRQRIYPDACTQVHCARRQLPCIRILCSTHVRTHAYLDIHARRQYKHRQHVRMTAYVSLSKPQQLWTGRLSI